MLNIEKTFAYMRRLMDPTLHEHIYDETKADVVWKKIENLFARKTSGNKTTLIRIIVNLKYKDGNNMVENIFSRYCEQVVCHENEH